MESECRERSGPAAAELLVDAVRDMGGDELRAARRIVDAYGGVGLFAVMFAAGEQVDRSIIVVEGSAAACDDARVNLDGRDVTVVCSPVEMWTPEPADVVIADPSRTGLGKAATEVLAATGARVLVLVGCDPVAFARDVGLLATAGYHLSRAVTLDLFPQTHHVEVVGRFERTTYASDLAEIS